MANFQFKRTHLSRLVPYMSGFETKKKKKKKSSSGHITGIVTKRIDLKTHSYPAPDQGDCDQENWSGARYEWVWPIFNLSGHISLGWSRI